ncbi:MAG: AtpZ/AtpI family protein [Phycisphaerae bacterium]|nr:AtpZ/AtpI family protein [Phycisphaerae bacterium]
MSDEPSPQGGPPEDEDRRQSSEWNRLSALAFEFIGYMAVLGYAGYQLDVRYGWGHRGILCGLLLALAAWLYRFYRQTRDLFR